MLNWLLIVSNGIAMPVASSLVGCDDASIFGLVFFCFCFPTSHIIFKFLWSTRVDVFTLKTIWCLPGNFGNHVGPPQSVPIFFGISSVPVLYFYSYPVKVEASLPTVCT